MLSYMNSWQRRLKFLNLLYIKIHKSGGTTFNPCCQTPYVCCRCVFFFLMLYMEQQVWLSPVRRSGLMILKASTRPISNFPFVPSHQINVEWPNLHVTITPLLDKCDILWSDILRTDWAEAFQLHLTFLLCA